MLKLGRNPLSPRLDRSAQAQVRLDSRFRSLCVRLEGAARDLLEDLDIAPCGLAADIHGQLRGLSVSLVSPLAQPHNLTASSATVVEHSFDMVESSEHMDW